MEIVYGALFVIYLVGSIGIFWFFMSGRELGTTFSLSFVAAALWPLWMMVAVAVGLWVAEGERPYHIIPSHLRENKKDKKP